MTISKRGTTVKGMRSQTMRLLLAVFALICALTGIFLAVLVAISALSPGAGGLACAGVLLAGTAAGTVAVVHMSRTLNGLRTFQTQDLGPDAEHIGLRDFIRDDSPLMAADTLKSVIQLLLTINEDLALLQRSGTKFDLFASDILYSSRKLANQSEGQLAQMQELGSRTRDFFGEFSRISEQLSLLRGAIGEGNAAALAARSGVESAQTRLATLVEAAARASGLARKGADNVRDTVLAADHLEEGLAQLAAISARTQEEAGQIATTLAALGDIVERTHVLATNASIEAARAGKQGEGFAVIAREIRTLAGTSRQALEETGRVLGSIRDGIVDSSRQTRGVHNAAGDLGKVLAETGEVFEGIQRQSREVEEAMQDFDGLFREVIEASGRSSASAAESVEKIQGFEKNYHAREEDYEHIVSKAEASEHHAHEARLSARILAQLASYLKAGGVERNRVLHRYLVIDGISGQRFGRKERRAELLYNLEAYDPKGTFLGHLGDLSGSGLMLVARERCEPGSRLDLDVALPISSEGERRVRISVVVKRVQADKDAIRLGCCIDDASRKSPELKEILASLSMENWLGNGNQDGQAPDGGSSTAHAAAGQILESDVEELEEL